MKILTSLSASRNSSQEIPMCTSGTRFFVHTALAMSLELRCKLWIMGKQILSFVLCREVAFFLRLTSTPHLSRQGWINWGVLFAGGWIRIFYADTISHWVAKFNCQTLTTISPALLISIHCQSLLIGYNQFGADYSYIMSAVWIQSLDITEIENVATGKSISDMWFVCCIEVVHISEGLLLQEFIVTNLVYTQNK